MINIILTILFFALIVGGLLWYKKKLSDVPKETVDEQVGERITEQQQVDKVEEIFDSLIKEDLSLQDLDEKSYRQKEAIKTEVLTNLSKCSQGDLDAREKIKQHVFSMMSEGRTGLTDKNINSVIHFEDIRRLSNRDMFEIAHYMLTKKFEKEYKKKTEEEKATSSSPTASAMHYFITSNGLHKGVWINGEFRHVITTQRLKEAFIHTMVELECLKAEKDENGEVITDANGNPKYSYRLNLELRDKYKILSQRIYEEYKGLSSADIFLNDAGIDEVDGGVSGIPDTGFQFKLLPNMQYSWQHLWIVFKGVCILLESYGFGDTGVEGLQRVCNIIYKSNPPYALTEETGFVPCSMADGTRIVVSIPPFGEDYAFFARKHDTAKGFKPEDLINEGQENSAYKGGTADTIKILKWATLGKLNILCSGIQGCGKTTFIKMLFHYISEDNIRVNEMMFELGLRYAFPTKNIYSMQATQNVTMQMGIDIGKKMNGQTLVLGEIAESILTVLFSQMCSRGGAQALATFHGKDTDECIKSMAQDLVEQGICTSLSDGKAKVAEILNINIHLDSDRPKIDLSKLSTEDAMKYAEMDADEDDKSRHIGFIDEVIPLVGTRYPHPKPKTQEEMWENTTEYYMRETDRVVYRINRLVEFENGYLVVKNVFSDEMCDKIANTLTRKDELQFRRDMEEIKSHIRMTA